MNNKLENKSGVSDIERKNWLIYFLTILGSVDALYLTWTKLIGVDALCSGIGKCGIVNASSYSTIAGIPIAALGLVMYLMIGGFTLLERYNASLRETFRLAVFGLSLLGFMFSMWLTYVSIVIIEETCIYCLGSAVVISVIFITSILRIRDLS